MWYDLCTVLLGMCLRIWVYKSRFKQAASVGRCVWSFWFLPKNILSLVLHAFKDVTQRRQFIQSTRTTSRDWWMLLVAKAEELGLKKLTASVEESRHSYAFGFLLV